MSISFQSYDEFKSSTTSTLFVLIRYFSSDNLGISNFLVGVSIPYINVFFNISEGSRPDSLRSDWILLARSRRYPSINKSAPEVLIKLNAFPDWPLPPATDTNKSVVVTQSVPVTVKSIEPS